MSEDLNNKIKQITDILGQDNLPDNIKGLLSLLSSQGSKEECPSTSNDIPAQKETRADKSELEENVDMLRKAKKIMDRLNTANDPRINLLTAIKPFMSNKRQNRLNNCIKMLHMTKLTSLFDEQEMSKL